MKNFTLLLITEDSSLYPEATTNYDDYVEEVQSLWAIVFEDKPEPIFIAQADDGNFFFADSEGTIQSEHKILAVLVESLA